MNGSQDPSEVNDDGDALAVVASNVEERALGLNKDVFLEFFAPWYGHGLRNRLYLQYFHLQHRSFVYLVLQPDTKGTQNMYHPPSRCGHCRALEPAWKDMASGLNLSAYIRQACNFQSYCRLVYV